MSNNVASNKVWYAPNKFQAYGEEEIRAVTECLKRGWLAPGPETDRFQERVAKYFGKDYGIFVNSGSSANMVALMLAGVKKGTRVVTCALTFNTTIAPIIQLGGIPCFIDADEGHYVPSVDAIVEAVESTGSKIVFLPNLVGEKPDWDHLRARLNRDVLLIEDSCDTMTNTPCTDISTTSFYASHIITAGGTGGMVMVNSTGHRDRALSIRDWGRVGNNSEEMSDRFQHDVDGILYDGKFLYSELGYNFKACEMNAAFGNVQMDHLHENKAIRKRNVARYVERLQGSIYGLPKNNEKTDWLAMPLTTVRRHDLASYLEARDIQVRVCFAGNVTRHPAYRKDYLQDFPVADHQMKEGILLGAHHGLTLSDVDRVCDALLAFAESIII